MTQHNAPIAESIKPGPSFVEIVDGEHKGEHFVIVEEQGDGLEPKRSRLKLDCKATRCNDALHCFRKSRKMAVQGPCRDCGEELVDWERVRSRDAGDAAFVFEELQKEMVRHIYWHVPFDQHAINAALRKGRSALYGSIKSRIHASVGSAHNPSEGMQTGWSRSVYYYAQHATASCCRRCIAYWHGIPTDSDLSEEQEQYLCELVRMYLDTRLPLLVPQLQKEGIRVRPIRKPKMR